MGGPEIRWNERGEVPGQGASSRLAVSGALAGREGPCLLTLLLQIARDIIKYVTPPSLMTWASRPGQAGQRTDIFL